MKKTKIAILGGGNLGQSITKGLLALPRFNPLNLTVTRRKVHLLDHLKKKGVTVSGDNKTAVADAEIVILAVQPSQAAGIMWEIQPLLNPEKHILISVVTGLHIDEIQKMAGENIPVFRAMPNTAIALRESMTCIATDGTSEDQKSEVLGFFNRLGKAIFIDEALMASATVLGACGVAYALRFIRAASQGGIEIGFDADLAQLIATQTVKGAASLLLEGGTHPESEIDKVTTPRGCTIAGLNEMEHQGFSSALIKGITTSHNKISDIADGD